MTDDVLTGPAQAEIQWPIGDDTPETFGLRAALRDGYARGWGNAAAAISDWLNAHGHPGAAEKVYHEFERGSHV